MKKKEPIPLGARLAIGSLAILGHTAGWLITITGGFSHSHKYTKEVTHVAGMPAYAVAAIFFVMGTLALAALLQETSAKRSWTWMACCATLVAPILYAKLI